MASDEAFKLVSELYHNNYDSLHAMAQGESIDEETFQKLRHRFRMLCDCFDQQYLYLLQPSPENEYESIMYISVATDDEEDRVVSANDRGVRVTIPNGIGPCKRAAMNGEFPDTPDFVDNQYGRVYSWYFPLINKDKKVDFLVGMDYREDEVGAKFFRITLYLLIPIAIQLILILIVLLLFVKKIVMNPLSFVSASMRRFVEDHTQELPSLTDTLNPRGEIRGITNAYDQMKADIAEYLSDIRDLTQKEIRQAELDKLTEHIQKGILPSEAEVRGDGFSAYAFDKTAKNVGGDFYDCFIREDGSICSVIGDVSGKGITAALFMAMTKTMIREQSGT